jgi:hypothetical protein
MIFCRALGGWPLNFGHEFEMSLKSWIKKLGLWGLLFFLLKGLLWLTIPVLIALFADQ